MACFKTTIGGLGTFVYRIGTNPAGVQGGALDRLLTYAREEPIEFLTEAAFSGVNILHHLERLSTDIIAIDPGLFIHHNIMPLAPQAHHIGTPQAYSSGTHHAESVDSRHHVDDMQIHQESVQHDSGSDADAPTTNLSMTSLIASLWDWFPSHRSIATAATAESLSVAACADTKTATSRTSDLTVIAPNDIANDDGKRRSCCARAAVRL